MSFTFKERQKLREVVDQAIIIAHREDVSELKSCLEIEGFKVVVLRSEYNYQEMSYSNASRTFLAHRNAWKKALDASGYTLICEADFVPCRGLGDFEIFWPADNPLAWGYLYQGSPRLLAIVDGYLRGHTAPLVSYVINGKVASLMERFFNHQKEIYDFRSYFTFDAHLQWYVMGLGAEAYIPKHHYGEHGGLPNPEHGALGSLPRQGRHRADNLMSRLHFLPPYAMGSHLQQVLVRLSGRLLGIARLITGRWITKTGAYKLRASDLIVMYLIGLRRLISLPL